jgi:hypothetical protein
MKAILEFNLDELDDRMAHLRCVKSTGMAIVLFDVIYNLRKKAENAPLEDGKTELDYFYELFNAELEAQGINIDELIQ